MPLVLMLEDEDDRIVRFETLLTKDDSITLHHWRTAPGFIDGFQKKETDPILICLDHDLFKKSPDEPDPGDGRDVARFLASQSNLCPILIHSTNIPAAESMFFLLDEAGWTVERISPIGQDWIEEFWWPTVLQLLPDHFKTD